MVGIQGQRQTLTLLQNDSVRSAASSTNPHVGAELGKVRHIRCRTFPRAMEKQWNTLFYHKQRSWKDCRICTANSPKSLQKRARLKKRSLEPAVRADVKAFLDEACANKLHPAERAHPTVATK
ncbi:hypothetical protein [Paenibacillus polymyxa]|uniref:hypothetical protein n=1 Tax=Paenibacillus polymyxa TaxID=1406 RepID=UPI001E587823|nr:hypothetical protein [Paenibacillus polymyxa]